MSLYANREIEDQGEYYMRHLDAMTTEKLHSKGDIAAELAHRDMEIDRLKAQLGEGTKRPAINVWRYEDAPDHLKYQSQHGGDEDWVALVPNQYADEWIGWLESGSPFGVCDVQVTPQPDGSTLYIGAHS